MQNNQENKLILLEDLGYLYPTEISSTKKKFGLYKCYCGNEFAFDNELFIKDIKIVNETTILVIFED